MDEKQNLSTNEQLFEMLILETNNLVEQSEDVLIKSQIDKGLSEEHVNEIFRIMNTMKGSAGMMSFSNVEN